MRYSISGAISAKPLIEDKNHTQMTLLHIKYRGIGENMNTYVDKLTSGSVAGIISPFGRINVVAVM